MKVSNTFSYRYIGKKLILSNFKKNEKYLLNETGCIIFKKFIESKNMNELNNEILYIYRKKASDEKIQKNLDSAIDFFKNIGLLGEKNKIKVDKKSSKMKKQNKQIKKLENSLNVIRTAQIEVETLCNFNCKFCYMNGGYETRDSFKLKLDDYRKLFDDLQSLGTKEIIFSGGEPFLRKEFYQILELTKNYGFEINIYTNASLINEKYIDLLQKIRLKNLQISIYGNEENYLDFTRAKTNYYRSIQLCLKKMKKRLIPIYIVIPLTRANLVSNDFYEKLQVEYNTQFWAIIENSDIGKNKNARSQLSLNPDSIVCRKFLELKKVETDSYAYSCIIANKYVAVDVKGDVYPCYEYPFPVGNIHNVRFKKIWVNSPDLKMIRHINQIGNRREECKSCKFHDFCRFCIAKRVRETGSFHVFSNEECVEGKFNYNLQTLE